MAVEPTLRKVRSDAFDSHAPDTGCEAAPRCLECPLPHCRYDGGRGIRRVRNEIRDRQIIELRAAGGLTMLEIARRFGISRRSAFRIIEENRG